MVLTLNKFLIDEVVDISNGDTARVKNFYPSNNFIVLCDCASNNPYKLTAGMSITGRSSKMTAVMESIEPSIPENAMFYDLNYNTYEWQKNFDKLIFQDDGGAVVLDEIYNMYPHDIIEYKVGELSTGPFEILDCNLDECIILD